MTEYRFVQGIDYGARAGTLGFAVHMAEGGDGTLAYLARRGGESDTNWRTRVRGVSANFVILSTGEIVQMVGWSRASGSMNPRDRGPSTGFYNTRVIQDVLGGYYVNPNAWSLSVEVTGYRKDGPNAKQVAALLELVAEARRRYPSLKGAYGHADQTSYKGCPGLSDAMLTFWDKVGHGLFREQSTEGEEDMGPTFENAWPPIGTATTTRAIKIIPTAGEEWREVPVGTERHVLGVVTITGGSTPQYAGQRAYLVPVPDGPPVSFGLLLASAAVFTAATDEDASIIASLRAQVLSLTQRVDSIKKKVAALAGDVAND